MASKRGSKTPIKKEVDLNWVLKYLKDGNYPTGLNFSEKRMVRKRAERFCYLNGDIYYVGTPTDQHLGKKPRRVLLTHQEKWDAVEQCHVDAEGIHMGAEKTADGITAKFHWNGIYKFIKDYIRQCAICIERHPHMLAPSGQTDTVIIQDVDSDGIVEEDIFVVLPCEESSTPVKANPPISLIDLRLFGPYDFTTSVRFVLMGVGGQLTWMEVFVLDALTTDSVSNCLLQMICRYGQVENVTMSEQSDILLPVLVSALKQLKDQSDMSITLQKSSPQETAMLLKEAQGVIETFIKKNTSTWPEKIDFALLPLRLARQIASPAKVSTDVPNENTAAEALMSVRRGARSTADFTPPTQSPSKTPGGKGIVTRSRTGVTKPKTLDHDSYVIPGSKRRFSTELSSDTGSTAATDTPRPKRVKVELVNTPISVSLEDDTSDVDSEVSHVDNTSKKSVDLDTYYEAIKLYVGSQAYPDNSSRNFKRLIRDQAKNYCMKDGELYHEVGVKGQNKRIVMKREERIKLLTDAHLKSTTKQQMLSCLETVHWKGKLIDCEAFLLASPLADKHDVKANRDRQMSEAKRQLEFDREDTYQEINNYLVYDVFSNDDATKRLDYLKRQLKSFKVENGDLVHMSGNKKQKILLTAEDRQKAIAEAHLKKGSHADLTTTFYLLGESVFWFGMKCDVKIYINYCCTTENKHLIDRYFLFREHLMKHPMGVEVSNEIEERTQAAVDSISEVIHTQPDILPETNIVEVLTEEADTRSRGTFVSAIKMGEEMPADVSITEIPDEEVVLVAGDTGDIEPVAMETSEVVTETGAAPSNKHIDTGEATVEVNTSEDVEERPTRIIVKVTPDGNTIIVNEDGTETLTNTVIQQPSHSSVPSTAGGSDDVTMAAVKSILKDAGALGSNEYVVQTSTVAQTTVIQQEAEAEEQEDEIIELKMEAEEGTTVEEGTNTEDQMGDDSDDWLYDSDEEGDGVYDDDQQQQSLLAANLEGDSALKRVIVPRQHFKCSQCNKIFYGPIKFKMHMYKHTGQKPFPCNQCHKKYTNKKSLVIHQRTHTGELPYLCSLCGRRCPSKIALKSHLKCHDSEGGGFPAKCDVCDRVFTRKHLMERHKLHKHTNLQSEFKCTECNKIFGHQRSLRRHFMSAHLNVKNHVCGLCGKSFYRKEYLTGHLIQHGGAVAEGLSTRKSRSSFKPRPSVFNQEQIMIKKRDDSDDDDRDDGGDEQVQRIILHQDEHGQLRMVDVATEREVKRMLDARGLTQGAAGETMVVHIEEPSGEPQVVHVEHTEEQVVEVPIEEQSYVEYQPTDDTRAQEFVISAPPASTSSGQYMYATSASDMSIQCSQELVYGQPAVQYEVECVGEVGDEEALSAINLLAQASAQQYENVISQI